MILSIRLKNRRNILSSTVFVAGAICAVATGSIAQTLSFEEQVLDLLENHPRIKAANETINSLKEQVRINQKAWFPALALTGSVAKEARNNVTGTPDTNLNSNELKLTLTQPIYDFGSKSALTKIARLQLEQAEKTLELTRQSIILEIGVAQTGVSTAIEKLRYAQRSLLNLKKL